jgi:hypothetical protein
MLNRLKEEHCASLLEVCRRPLCSRAVASAKACRGARRNSAVTTTDGLFHRLKCQRLHPFCPRVADAHDECRSRGLGESEFQKTRVIIFCGEFESTSFCSVSQTGRKIPVPGLSAWQLAIHQLRNRFRQRMKHQCKETGTRDATVSSL